MKLLDELDKLLDDRPSIPSKMGGPKTPVGKAISRMNALKSGLFAKALPPREVLSDTPGEYQILVDKLADDYHPTTHTETVIIESLALGFLRLRRVMEMEQALFADPSPDVLDREAPKPPDFASLPALAYGISLVDRFIQCVNDGMSFDFTAQEQSALAEHLFSFIIDTEVSFGMCRNRMREMVYEQAAKPAETVNKTKRDPSELDDMRSLNKDLLAQVRMFGGYALPITGKDQIAKMLANETPIPDDKKPKWLALAQEVRNNLKFLQGDNLEYEENKYQRMLRRRALVLENPEKLGTIARFEASIRRAIEKDIQILASLAMAKTRGLVG